MTETETKRRTALVTGAGRGIGRAIAVRLAADHDVVVHYRRDWESAEATLTMVRERGADGMLLAAELADSDHLDAALDTALEGYGRIDTLVASAASTRFGTVLSSRPDHVRKTMDTVVVSFVQLCGRLMGGMSAGGRIVAISGLNASRAQPGHGLLGAAKAALEALVRSVAVEVADRDITVNAIVPGAIATKSLDSYFRGDDGARAAMAAGIPSGRFGRPEDVAGLVAWLVGPESAYLTGQVITLDGGVAAESGTWAGFRHLWDRPS
jgi:NAD(P)-dependent dehydrogenase (short-subunit alcohol dehydrogenase family)